MGEMSQIYKIGHTGCLLYLGMLSAWDIRCRRLPVWLLAAGGGAAVVFQLLGQGIPAVVVAAGGAVGGVFLLVSKVTKEDFGYGDSVLIGILGIYLGVWSLLSLLTITFLMTAGTAMAVLVRKQFRRKTALPFVPFLGAGYVVMLLAGGF